ncbi:MAG TPA: hypothetical protein PKN44_13435 [Bacteroidales bacterium]|nr:hypothetical protein [Bacteroidales bacterium]HPS50925.1 hypothetical protein [Bacteroidales bacterium]
MKKTQFKLIILILLLTIVSCKKDENPSPPVITLNNGPAYTADKSVIAVGGRLYFGISASGEDANITNLVIKKIMPDGSVKVMLDSGLNATGFSINETFFQSVEPEARWTFQVMDRNRQFATTAITIFKDPNSTWGGIFEYNNITLGYQNNAAFGPFCNALTGRVFTKDTAAMYPDSIDIATYFYVDDELPSPTFSSPGEQGGGITEYYPEIANWTTKRYTKWDVSVDTDPVPPAVFDACHNDSLLILSYDDVWGKRKFKWASPGDVIPFITAAGKKGLIKVVSADQDPTGKITFSMKIQQ